jgi:hypothetical protein
MAVAGSHVHWQALVLLVTNIQIMLSEPAFHSFAYINNSVGDICSSLAISL